MSNSNTSNTLRTISQIISQGFVTEGDLKELSKEEPKIYTMLDWYYGKEGMLDIMSGHKSLTLTDLLNVKIHYLNMVENT